MFVEIEDLLPDWVDDDARFLLEISRGFFGINPVKLFDVDDIANEDYEEKFGSVTNEEERIARGDLRYAYFRYAGANKEQAESYRYGLDDEED